MMDNKNLDRGLEIISKLIVGEEIKRDGANANLYEEYVSYQLVENGEIISQGSILFCPPKHFRFTDPELNVRTEGDEIIVSASAYAKSVEIRNKNDDLILSDNFFDMNGGERRIKILKGKAEGLEVRSVYDIR